MENCLATGFQLGSANGQTWCEYKKFEDNNAVFYCFWGAQQQSCAMWVSGSVSSPVITVLATAERWYSWTLVLTEAIVDTLIVSA